MYMAYTIHAAQEHLIMFPNYRWASSQQEWTLFQKMREILL